MRERSEREGELKPRKWEREKMSEGRENFFFKIGRGRGTMRVRGNFIKKWEMEKKSGRENEYRKKYQKERERSNEREGEYKKPKQKKTEEGEG
jgi:hypothetical protein